MLNPASLVVGARQDGDADEGTYGSFSADESTYAAGEIVRYEWDSDYKDSDVTGPGFTRDAEGRTAPVYLRDDDPAPKVVLRVTTSDGLQALSQPVGLSVRNVPPAVRNLAAPRYVAVGVADSAPDYITGRLVDPGFDPLTGSIDFGDGTPPATPSLGSDGRFFERHGFAGRGDHTVRVSVSDDDGGSSSAEITVTAVDLLGTVRDDARDVGSVGTTAPPLPGVTVYLDLDEDGRPDDGEPSRVTDDAGNYRFDALDPGPYRVRIVPPGDGWRVSSPAGGSRLVTISGSQGARVDFWTTDRSRITGSVFDDRNGNGVRDAGEGAQFGLVSQVYLDLNDNGSYEFGEPRSREEGTQYVLGALSPGTYKVRFLVDWVLETNWPYMQTLPAGPGGHEGNAVTIGRGEVAAGRDFGVITAQSSSVSGVAFEDRNRNGSANPDAGIDTPIQGRVVYIDADNDGTLDPDERRQKTALSLSSGQIQPYDFWVRPGTYTIRQVVPEGWVQSYPAAGAAQVVTVAAGQNSTGRNFASHRQLPYEVVARHVFYNRSAYDGNDAAANARDDGAIATDKRALLPGQAAGFVNLTGYTRGINGIMVDIRGVPDPDFPRITAADFVFEVGDGVPPDPGAAPGWKAAPAPSSVALRRGAGVEGTDRVTVVWPDGAVRNQWLRVTVRKTARTGIDRPDVFYFGNLAGETGDGAGTNGWRVSAMDLAAVRRAMHPRATIATATDFNRDGRTNALDLLEARRGLTAALPLPTAPASFAGSPAVRSVAEDLGLVSERRTL